MIRLCLRGIFTEKIKELAIKDRQHYFLEYWKLECGMSMFERTYFDNYIS